MRILVNAFHPDLAVSTVNRRWVEGLRQHPTITLNLQYTEYPDWRIRVDREQRLMEAHDRIVFQHPFYWYATPPLMKKWFDEVLTFGWAYGPGGTALTGKEWVTATSTGSAADSYQPDGYNRFPMRELLSPQQQTANLVGMRFLKPFIFHGAMTATSESVDASAMEYLAHIQSPTVQPW